MVVIQFPDGFGRRIRAARRARGMSLATLSQRVHLDEAQLSRLERERTATGVSLALVAACASALGDAALWDAACALVSASVAGDLHVS